MSSQYIAGKYEVLDELGHGAFGSVFLVRHLELETQYALKLLRVPSSGHRDIVENFVHQAQALQRLSHRGVAQLREFGRAEDGSYYLTTDFCDGLTLREILTYQAVLPTERALNLCIQILEILEYAHREGVVHRDLKPENIILDQRQNRLGEVKIVDFSPPFLRSLFRSSYSNCGDPLGSPLYMSPEQAAGVLDTDPRSDLYSVGIMLFEFLTGHPPFVGVDDIDTLAMHIAADPTRILDATTLAPDLSALLQKALQKRREDRFQDAIEFRRACEVVQVV